MTAPTPDPPTESPMREFLLDQIGRLDAFAYVMLSSPVAPMLKLEIGRDAEGAYQVCVPPRSPSTPLPVPMRAQLVEAGFRSADAAQPLEPWVRPVARPSEAIDVAVDTLRTVFDVTIGPDLDLVHGSHRAEHEARQQFEALHERIEELLTQFIGHAPEQDGDGDFVYLTDHARVIIAPRVVPGALAVVRVIAITNAGVNVTPELGLFLAGLNFGLVFGRFALDTRHQAIWFDESLLGDTLTEAQLRFTIDMVAATAGEWAGRLQQMFGGHVLRDLASSDHEAAEKPGTGGYL